MAPRSSQAAVEDGVLRRVSPSQIKEYEQCPRKWYFAKVQGLPVVSRNQKSLDFGSALHKEIENFILEAQPLTSPLAKLGLEYIPTTSGLLVETRVEDPWVYAAGIMVDGYIDLTVPPGPDIPEIIDWKTTSDIDKWGKTSQELRTDVQMLTYAKWAHAKYDADEVRLSHVQFQTKGRPWVSKKSTVLTLDETNRAWLSVNHQVANMSSDAGKKTPAEVHGNTDSCDNYGGCPFQHVCPSHTRGKDMASLLEKLRGKTADVKPMMTQPLNQTVPVVPFEDKNITPTKQAALDEKEAAGRVNMGVAEAKRVTAAQKVETLEEETARLRKEYPPEQVVGMVNILNRLSPDMVSRHPFFDICSRLRSHGLTPDESGTQNVPYWVDAVAAHTKLERLKGPPEDMTPPDMPGEEMAVMPSNKPLPDAVQKEEKPKGRPKGSKNKPKDDVELARQVAATLSYQDADKALSDADLKAVTEGVVAAENAPIARQLRARLATETGGVFVKNDLDSGAPLQTEFDRAAKNMAEDNAVEEVRENEALLANLDLPLRKAVELLIARSNASREAHQKARSIPRVNADLRLFINCYPSSPSRDLTQYVNELNIEASNQEKIPDVRLSESKLLGFGKWKGVLAQLAKASPPTGDCFISTSDLNDPVIEALIPLAALVVRAR